MLDMFSGQLTTPYRFSYHTGAVTYYLKVQTTDQSVWHAKTSWFSFLRATSASIFILGCYYV